MLVGVLVLVSLGSVLVGAAFGRVLVRVRGRRQLRQVHVEFEGRWRARFPGPMIVRRTPRPDRNVDAVADADELFVVRDGGEAYPLIRGKSPGEYEIHHLGP